MMNDTSGRSGSGSSKCVDLQSCLASRLQARLGESGTPEYRIKSKDWATKSGRRIFALRASGHRMPAKGSTGLLSTPMRGWATPTLTDSKGGRNQTCVRHHHNPKRNDGQTLCDQAHLSGWGTPNASNPGGTPEAALKRKEGLPCGASVTTLEHQVQLAGWPTTRACDGDKHSRTIEGAAREIERKGGPQDLSQASTLCAFDETMPGSSRPEQEASSGQVTATTGDSLTTLPVETARSAPLNVDHSLWLMGYPAEWLTCVDWGTQLSRS